MDGVGRFKNGPALVNDHTFAEAGAFEFRALDDYVGAPVVAELNNVRFLVRCPWLNYRNIVGLDVDEGIVSGKEVIKLAIRQGQ